MSRQAVIDAVWWVTGILSIMVALGPRRNLSPRFDYPGGADHNEGMTNTRTPRPRRSTPAICQHDGDEQDWAKRGPADRCQEPADFVVGFSDEDGRYNVWFCRRHADEAMENGTADGVRSA